jgi:hypothetical protein
MGEVKMKRREGRGLKKIDENVEWGRGKRE